VNGLGGKIALCPSGSGRAAAKAHHRDRKGRNFQCRHRSPPQNPGMIHPLYQF
jgi:hypothetical protein